MSITISDKDYQQLLNGAKYNLYRTHQIIDKIIEFKIPIDLELYYLQTADRHLDFIESLKGTTEEKIIKFKSIEGRIRGIEETRSYSGKRMFEISIETLDIPDWQYKVVFEKRKVEIALLSPVKNDTTNGE